MSPRPNIDHIRRPQLISAAIEVIAERGLAATRIADVAARAGTSSAAVLYWFESKDELLAAALTEEDDRFYADVTSRIATGLTPPEQLALLIEASAQGGEWTLWMESWSRAMRDPDAARTRELQDRRWREVIAGVVRAGQRSGDFSEAVEPAEVAAALAALMDGLAIQLSLGDPEMPPRRMVAIARAVASEQLGCELSRLRPAPAAEAEAVAA